MFLKEVTKSAFLQEKKKKALSASLGFVDTI